MESCACCGNAVDPDNPITEEWFLFCSEDCADFYLRELTP